MKLKMKFYQKHFLGGRKNADEEWEHEECMDVGKVNGGQKIWLKYISWEI